MSWRSRPSPSSSTRYYISNSYNPPNVFSNATFISAAVLGCCLGFLPHNFHPARLFMGDSGALLLGLLLAAATISLSGSVDPGIRANGGSLTAALLPIAVPLAVLSLPFLDMVLAVVRRTLAGKNPWDPDRKHLHHRMLDLGHGHRNAVLILYMWAALLALGTVSLAFVESWRAAIVIGVCLAVVVRPDRVAAQVDPTEALVIVFTSTWKDPEKGSATTTEQVRHEQ